MKLQRIHLKISGRVQGVGFRQNTLIEARKLRIVGWVHNTSDGLVEIMAEAPPESLSRFVEWCHHGPRHAVVSRVEVVSASEIETAGYADFSIEIDTFRE